MTQKYKMVNSAVEGFVEYSPVVESMKEAEAYFLSNFSTEIPGCNIIQTEGIVVEGSPNFTAFPVWATPQDAEAFEAKYGFIPPYWQILSEEEQDAQCQAEFEKELRKGNIVFEEDECMCGGDGCECCQPLYTNCNF